MDLRLDDAPPPELLTDPAHLRRILPHLPPGRRHPVPAQDLLGLVFMDLQDNLLRDGFDDESPGRGKTAGTRWGVVGRGESVAEGAMTRGLPQGVSLELT